ncbi:MAG: chorismate mutase [Alphaproteobacteria bacterium]
MTIEDIRDKIDDIDKDIARLLKQRWQQVNRISQLKKLIPQQAGYRPFRERDIYEKLPEDDEVKRDEYWTIWKEIMTTTVMRENAFQVAVAENFFHQYGFWLAQEFGRRTKWLTDNIKTDDEALCHISERRAGLAVVSLQAVDSFLAWQNNIAIVNIFPSFMFANDNKISPDNILGLIVAWQTMEQVDGDAALAVVLDKEKKKFDIVMPNKAKQQNIIAMVPRPYDWQDEK